MRFVDSKRVRTGRDDKLGNSHTPIQVKVRSTLNEVFCENFVEHSY